MMKTLLITCLYFCLTQTGLAQTPGAWQSDFPKNAFDNWLVDPAEILEGGPGRDGIPAIDSPTFIPVEESDLAAQAPVIALEIDGVARAYPLEILIWHEIVNDEVAGLPVAVTYCPLCNAALVFRRELDGRLLDFGTTGRLRKSDLVMYDRQTESWWQQFEGRALVGELAGSQLTLLPSRLEGFASFKARFPGGAVLVRPAGFDRPYGIMLVISIA